MKTVTMVSVGLSLGLALGIASYLSPRELPAPVLNSVIAGDYHCCDPTGGDPCGTAIKHNCATACAADAIGVVCQTNLADCKFAPAGPDNGVCEISWFCANTCEPAPPTFCTHFRDGSCSTIRGTATTTHTIQAACGQPPFVVTVIDGESKTYPTSECICQNDVEDVTDPSGTRTTCTGAECWF